MAFLKPLGNSPNPHSVFAPPYALDALSPHIGGETLCFIVERILPNYAHHRTTQTPCPYAIELYHHAFWLHHLTGNYRSPSDLLMARICRDFGSFDKFHHEFTKHAHRLDVRFVWLVADNDRLKVITTDRQSILDTPYVPLFACNLWQHAYYLDYRNRASDYITACLGHLVDWQKAERAYLTGQIWQATFDVV